MNSARTCATIKREIDIHRTVDHPNIAKLYSVHETENHIILKLEYVEGQELYHRCYRHVKESDAKIFMRQLLQAMNYLHGKYILHLDVKPENIIVTRNDQIKLIDLGISKKFVWTEEISAGTAGFVAPEILHDRKADGRADVYSLGVVFYCMLSGRLPYQK